MWKPHSGRNLPSAPSKHSLEKQPEVVKDYANHFGYEFNYNKCSAIVFTPDVATHTILEFGDHEIRG